MRDFSNFGSLKSTETAYYVPAAISTNGLNFSNFGSLKSTETFSHCMPLSRPVHFSNFGSLKSTETLLLSFGNLTRAMISAISAR